MSTVCYCHISTKAHTCMIRMMQVNYGRQLKQLSHSFNISHSNLRHRCISMLSPIWYCQINLRSRACTCIWLWLAETTFVKTKFWTHCWETFYISFYDYMSFSDLYKKFIISIACVWAAIWLDENLNGCNFFIFQTSKLTFRMLTNILNLYIMALPKFTSACGCMWINFDSLIQEFLSFCKNDIVFRCLTCWYVLFFVKWLITSDI